MPTPGWPVRARPKPRSLRARGRLAAWLGLAALLLGACSRDDLADLRAQGTLRVGTLNQPTSYYLGAQGPEGYDYALVAAFARRLDLQLVIIPARDNEALRKLLASGQADLVAAQLTADSDWRHAGVPTQSYHEEPQLVLKRRGQPTAQNISSLVDRRLVVRAGSPQLAELQRLRREGQAYLSWTELPRETADPLDWISSGDADFAIVDEAEFRFARHLYPEAVVAFSLPDPRPLHWIVRRSAPGLLAAANDFISEGRASGLLAKLDHAAAPESSAIVYETERRFQDDIGTLLPPLRPLFEQAALESGVDWRLLAAVGYQESHWDNTASSANGAVGMMMLTTQAAQAMGVAERTNLQQNIRGGALYLAQTLQRIPARIPEPDRTWLALAAYNAGYGHLEDARVLAQSNGADPDQWKDVARFLPMLAEERYYLQARRGYARGWEPVRFVEQIRGFFAVLQWYGGTQAGAPPAALSTAATAPSAPARKKLP
jgi:membrane-bound lytic murein transglycosylase F